MCHKKKQLPIKRCKHFELGGDKKRKVFKMILYYLACQHYAILYHITHVTFQDRMTQCGPGVSSEGWCIMALSSRGACNGLTSWVFSILVF